MFFPRFQIPGSLDFQWCPMDFPRILGSRVPVFQKSQVSCQAGGLQKYQVFTRFITRFFTRFITRFLPGFFTRFPPMFK